MSVASSPSFPCMKLRNPPSPSAPPCPSYSPSSYSSSTSKFTIRSSQAEGPLRRPVARARAASCFACRSAAAAVQGQSVITLEYQRQKAKELQEYFKLKKLKEADQGPFFGFIGKNEIASGRI